MAFILIGIIFGLILLLGFITFYYYNRFVTLINRIENSLSQIDVQLKRRADLIPNLIKSVKGYMKHETAAIKAVTDARKALISAGNIEKKVQADNQLENALKSIFAIAEGYPDLKANQNFLELQRELTSTEDKIAYSRQFYNDSILVYNNLCTKIPGVIFARIFGKQKKDYLKITEAERKKVDVDF
jgi:LemA protein